ncbi:hypothetical protein [Halopseudomonas pachastrellae]|nr:hypothetical protein [Halopseudomonas pachastrellae]
MGDPRLGGKSPVIEPGPRKVMQVESIKLIIGSIERLCLRPT